MPLLRSPVAEFSSTVVPSGMLMVLCSNLSTVVLSIGASYRSMRSHFSRSQTLAKAKLTFVLEGATGGAISAGMAKAVVDPVEGLGGFSGALLVLG